MKIKNIIFNSMKQSLQVIRKSPGLFAVLFFTQLLFIILMSFVFAFYAIQVGEYAETIMGSLEGSEIMEAAASPMLAIPDISAASTMLINSIIMFFIVSYFLYIVLNGINWDFTNMIVSKREGFLHYQLMFGILALIFTLPAMIIINLFSKLFMSLEASTAFIIIGFLVLLIAVYFMYISLSLINQYKVKELKKLLKHAYNLGIKKFRIILPTYIIMLGFALIPLLLLSFLLDANLLLVIGFVVLLILGINFGRIYFLVAMKEIKN